MRVVLQPGEAIEIKLDGGDRMFLIDYGKENPDLLVVTVNSDTAPIYEEDIGDEPVEAPIADSAFICSHCDDGDKIPPDLDPKTSECSRCGCFVIPF